MDTHQYCSRVEHDLMGFFPDIYVRFFPELVGAANSNFFFKFKIGHAPHSFRIWWCALICIFNNSLNFAAPSLPVNMAYAC